MSVTVKATSELAVSLVNGYISHEHIASVRIHFCKILSTCDNALLIHSSIDLCYDSIDLRLSDLIVFERSLCFHQQSSLCKVIVGCTCALKLNVSSLKCGKIDLLQCKTQDSSVYISSSFCDIFFNLGLSCICCLCCNNSSIKRCNSILGVVGKNYVIRFIKSSSKSYLCCRRTCKDSSRLSVLCGDGSILNEHISRTSTVVHAKANR